MASRLKPTLDHLLVKLIRSDACLNFSIFLPPSRIAFSADWSPEMSPFLRICVLFLVAAFVFAGLDLLWLGMVMGDYYDAQLGPLKAQPVLKAPAVIFYAFYLGFLLRYGVLRAVDARESFQRGSLMGLFAYGTYEFTNWAVIQDW